MKLHQFLGRNLLLLGLALASLPSLPVPAQDQPPDQNQAEQPDPPGRVGRMSFSEGSVSFQPGGEGDWVQAVPNRPLTTGDNLWADKDSRAELHIGSTAVRLGPETSVTFLDLDDRVIQLRLSQGSLIVRAQHLDSDGSIEVDTPNLAFTLQQEGEYRIDVNADGSQTITDVFRGRGQVTGGGYTYTVIAGQQASFTGTDTLSYDIADIPPRDAFDDWAFDRDRREEQSVSARYVSPETTGYEDLDAYGQWQNVEGYGQVWAPQAVPAGWAPYRYGHWVWIEPWGWTWVDDEPWGFAPFHYGRWAFVRARWWWVPGPVAVRPVYAPALVVFVGGGGFRFAEGPGVAWFPLGPREVYVPARRFSPRYVENVNVTNTVVNVTQVTNVYNTYRTNNTTNINRITYVNQRRTEAVTAVSRDTFINARPVERNIVRVSDREIAAAPITRSVEERPTRASVVGAGAPARVRPPATVVNRQVMAERQPPPVRSFGGRETPEATRPLETGRPAVPRPGQPVPRPNQPASEPQRGGMESRPAETERPPDSHAPRPPDTSRPGERPPEPQRAPEASPAHPAQPAVNSRPQQAWTHPLARPVPPPREKDPRELQDEQNKQREWEQHHAQPPAPARPTDQRHAEPPKEGKPPKPPGQG